MQGGKGRRGRQRREEGKASGEKGLERIPVCIFKFSLNSPCGSRKMCEGKHPGRISKEKMSVSRVSVCVSLRG